MLYAVDLIKPDGTRLIGYFLFTNRETAERSAYSQIHGDPLAFWKSERKRARLTRKARKGWTFEIMEQYPA